MKDGSFKSYLRQRVDGKVRFKHMLSQIKYIKQKKTQQFRHTIMLPMLVVLYSSAQIIVKIS